MVLKSKEKNYFQLFELKEEYLISLEKLEQGFLRLQSQYHPDRFAHKNDEDQLMNMRYSAFINEAYTTLKSPVLRAQYLLELYDIEFDLEQTAFSGEDFLVKQMHWRDELESLKESYCDQQFQALKENVLQEEELLQQSFIQWWHPKNCQQNSEKAVILLKKMYFVDKIKQQLQLVKKEHV